MALYTGYVTSARGVCKIISIIIGFAICSMLCANWYGGRSCFGDGRLGFISGLNFVVVVINVILFLLNLLGVKLGRFESLYALVGAVLFVIASAIAIWFVIQEGFSGWLVAIMVGMISLALLFLWDLKILRGESSNSHLPV